MKKVSMGIMLSIIYLNVYAAAGPSALPSTSQPGTPASDDGARAYKQAAPVDEAQKVRATRSRDAMEDMRRALRESRWALGQGLPDSGCYDGWGR